MIVTLIFRVSLIVASTALYLGPVGAGGFSRFFSHPPLSALATVLFGLAIAAVFAGGNLSSGVREDRGNRWVIASCAAIGFLVAFLPAYSYQKQFWTLDRRVGFHGTR